MGKNRGLDCFSTVDLNLAVLDSRQHPLMAFYVHGFGQAVADSFENQGMAGWLDISRHGVVLAGNLGGENSRQQVVGPHALYRRGDPAAPHMADQGQEPGCVPAEPRPEQWSLQHRLNQYVFHGFGR